MQTFLLVRDQNGNTLLPEMPLNEASTYPDDVEAHIADDGNTVVVTVYLEEVEDAS